MLNALKLKLFKGFSGVICCLIYTGLQHDKASFPNGRSISATTILLQVIFVCTGKVNYHQIWLERLLDIKWSSHWIIGALWLRISDKPKNVSFVQELDVYTVNFCLCRSDWLANFNTPRGWYSHCGILILPSILLDRQMSSCYQWF